MVEELKLAIKIDDDAIEQSLLKQFNNAEKMADKVVLTFKNINLDDKNIEAKFKEMQKMAGKNPIDFSISDKSVEMLSAISKQLSNIFEIANGKSLIDSSSTVSDIGKIANATNQQIDAVKKTTSAYKNQAYELASVLKMLEKMDRFNEVSYAGSMSKAIKANAKSYKKDDIIQFSSKDYNISEEALKQLRGLSVNLEEAFNYSDTLGLDIATIKNVEVLIQYFRELLKEKLEFNNTKLNTADIEELIKALGIAKKEVFDDGTGKKINSYDGYLNKYSSVSEIISFLKQQEQQILATAEAEQKLANVEQQSSNSSLAENQDKIQQELKETEKVAEQTAEALEKVNLNGNKSNISSENTNGGIDGIRSYWKKYGTSDSDNYINNKSDVTYNQIIRQLTEEENLARGIMKQITRFIDPSNLLQDVDTDYFKAVDAELEKLGYHLDEIKIDENSHIASAKILPIDDKAITNAEEMMNILKNISSNPTIEDVFQNDSNSSSTAKEEVSVMEQVETATEQAVQAKKDFATANEGVQDSVADSRSPLQLEAELMQQIAKDASDAANAKKEFVEANKQVKDSADDSNGSVKKDKYKNRKKISEDEYTSRYSDFASIANKTLTDNGNAILGNSVSTELVNGLVKVSAKIKTVDGDWKTFSAKIDADGNMFEQRFNTITKGVNKLNSELENFGKDTISTPKSDTQKSVDKALNQQISAWKKLESIREETEKTDPKNEKRIAELEEIKELYQKQYDEAKSILDINQDLYNVEKQTEQLKQIQLETDAKISKYRASQKASTVSSFQSSIDSYQSKLTKYSNRPTEKQSVEYQNLLTEYQSQLEQLKKRFGELSEEKIISEDQINSFNKLKEQLDTTDLKFQNVFKGDDLISVKKEIDTITQYMSKNTRISSEAKDKLRGYIEELKTKGADANVKAIHAAFLDVCDGERKAKREGQSFLDVLRDKVWYQWAAQIGSYFSLNDILRYAKEGIQTVRELDTALTEMRKVSDESVQSLKNYQATTFDVANEIGTTAIQIQNSTADWMRLGYSIQEASELAKNSNIYKNVGDMEIEEATEHMISSVQAWKSEFNDNVIDTSKAVIDRYNKIGNEFAISSADIGQAMETSAAALKAGGNSLNESLGILTAANIIQQDASTTSSALKILSLRIRGRIMPPYKVIYMRYALA